MGRELWIGLGFILLAGESFAAPLALDCVPCLECKDTPDAWVTGFTLIDGIARWRAFKENETAQYLIEMKDGDSWKTILEVSPGGGSYEIPVAPTNGKYRLTEVEVSGKRIHWGTTGNVSSSSIVSRRKTVDIDANRSPQKFKTSFGESRTIQQKYVIFVANDGPFGELIEFYVDRDLIPLLDPEYDVIKERMSNYPPYTDVVGRRNAVDAKIALLASQGAQLFHLIGTSNDYWYLNGPFTASYWPPEWASQRAALLALTVPRVLPGDLAYRDLIPTFVIQEDNLDPETCMQQTRPYYFTDQPFADVTGDGVPDVVLTRWPVRVPSDVQKLVEKMARYNDSDSWGMQSEFSYLYLIGDEDFDNASDGILAASVASSVMSHMPGNLQPLVVKQSEHDGPYLLYQAALEKWNDPNSLYDPPEIVLFTGSRARKYDPATFFSKMFTPYSLVFEISDLTSTNLVVGLAATCSGADFVSEQWWDSGIGFNFGDAVCTDFVVNANAVGGKGAVAWIGPTGGSWQRANEIIAAKFIDHLYGNPYQSIARTWLAVVKELYAEYAGDAEIIETLRTYAFLGDPVSRMNSLHYDPVGVPEPSESAVAFTIGRNPFRGKVPLSFSLKSHANIRLSVYDVSGRRVKILKEGWSTGGKRYQYEWDGSNESGEDVAPGVYFMRLEIGTKAFTQKGVLLR